jgi:hypothetical protein
LAANEHHFPAGEDVFPVNEHVFVANEHHLAANEHDFAANEHHFLSNEHDFPANEVMFVFKNDMARKLQNVILLANHEILTGRGQKEPVGGVLMAANRMNQGTIPSAIDAKLLCRNHLICGASVVGCK